MGTFIWFGTIVKPDSSYHWWLIALSLPLRCPGIRSRGVLSLLGCSATQDVGNRQTAKTSVFVSLSINFILFLSSRIISKTLSQCELCEQTLRSGKF